MKPPTAQMPGRYLQAYGQQYLRWADIEGQLNLIKQIPTLKSKLLRQK